MKTLTGARKMMNMQKLGTVSRAGNSFHLLGDPQKQRNCGLMLYTLCEVKARGEPNPGSSLGKALLHHLL